MRVPGRIPGGDYHRRFMAKQDLRPSNTGRWFCQLPVIYRCLDKGVGGCLAVSKGMQLLPQPQKTLVSLRKHGCSRDTFQRCALRMHCTVVTWCRTLVFSQPFTSKDAIPKTRQPESWASKLMRRSAELVEIVRDLARPSLAAPHTIQGATCISQATCLLGANGSP